MTTPNLITHWARPSAVSAASVIAVCVLLPWFFLHQDRSAIDAVLLGYGLFFITWSVIFGVKLSSRSSREERLDQAMLLPILCLAVTIRLIAAHTTGHGHDLPIYKGWAMSATQLGLARSYVEQLNGNPLPDYPPLSMILFWATGHLYKLAISSDFDALLPSYNVIIRFPAIVADVIVCAVLAQVMRATRVPSMWAFTALVYAVHPVSLYDTGIWGQTDSIYTLWMLLALQAAASEKWTRVGIWTACALLTKPQSATMVPVLLVLMVKDFRYLPRFAAGAIAAGVVLLIPLMQTGVLADLLSVYQRTVQGRGDTISTGAYNFWAIPHRTARQSDTALALGLIPFRVAGLILFASATLLVLWRLRSALFSRDSRSEHLLSVLLCGALITSAMFIFATQMHERYQFAYIVLALPIAMLTPAGAGFYAATSLLILLNLVGQMAFSAVDMALFGAFPFLPRAIAIAQVVIFFVTVAKACDLVRSARDEHRAIAARTS